MYDLKSSPGIFKVTCFRERKKNRAKQNHSPSRLLQLLLWQPLRTSRKPLPIYQRLDGCLISLFCHYPIIGNAEK